MLSAECCMLRFENLLGRGMGELKSKVATELSERGVAERAKYLRQ